MLINTLKRAVAAGKRIVVSYGCETDYEGFDADKAFEAITACDEIEVYFQEMHENYGWKNIASALIVNDPEPEVCDCGGRWESYE